MVIVPLSSVLDRHISRRPGYCYQLVERYRSVAGGPLGAAAEAGSTNTCVVGEPASADGTTQHDLDLPPHSVPSHHCVAPSLACLGSQV